MPADKEPYVGPRPFQREDQALFFGRQREANEGLSLIVAHPVSLLYGQSGAGKTSFINAILIPLLESEENAEVLPIARVAGTFMPEELQPEAIANIYVLNTLMCWHQGRENPKTLAQLSLSEYLKSLGSNSEGEDMIRPLVVIFDQFEELFTSYPERWQDREKFFIQIGDVLEQDRRLRVVFAMREDYMGEFDPYVHLLPERLSTRFRLERLREQAALQAVRQPLSMTNRRFSKGVAEQLVDSLMKIPVKTSNGQIEVKGQFVDPVQLQIVSQNLWRRLKPEEREITESHLKNSGDVGAALSAFYDETISAVTESTGIEERILRRWFEITLITPEGTRAIVYRGTHDTGGVPSRVADMLEERHLLKAESRNGAIWYELTHDRFIEPIKESNQRWLREHSRGDDMPNRLEHQAREWVRNDRSPAYLLTESEISETERWLRSKDASVIGYSDMLMELIMSSRTAVLKKEHLRTRVLISLLVLTIILLLIVIAMGLSFIR